MREPPGIACHQGEHPGRERGGEGAHEPRREPPRPVSAQHAEQQPDVAAGDPRGKARAVFSVLCPRAQLTRAPGDRASERAALPGVRRQRDAAGDVPGQPDDSVRCALAHRDRAERGHGQDRDAVRGADTGDHRPPRGLRREVGDAYREVPAAVNKHPASRRD
jgi:hypothetical protein